MFKHCTSDKIQKNYKKLEGDTNTIRFFVSTFITVWLIVATFTLSRMLRSYTEDWTLTKKNGRLLVVIWGFIIAYSCWLIDPIRGLIGFDSVFQMTMSWLILLFFCNCIPICLILYMHFRNVHSLGKIILKWA